ncbi:MAG: hypothetical protein EA001_14710 [Oscillatoriales cyanobacterium]|nr:MAG: hypothetical protein EA001_14710 [Oscillatoriales cyanobacterium]
MGAGQWTLAGIVLVVTIERFLIVLTPIDTIGRIQGFMIGDDSISGLLIDCNYSIDRLIVQGNRR